MPTKWEQNLHDLVAAIRAVCTTLADPSSNLILNANVGATAYMASPKAALGVLASMSAMRLGQRNDLLQAAGCDSSFPKNELLALLPSRRATHRPSADADCIEFLEDFVGGGGPDPDLVQRLIDQHGLIAFMRLAHIHNLVGALLVEVDDSLESLQALMAAEALADETEFMTWEDIE